MGFDLALGVRQSIRRSRRLVPAGLGQARPDRGHGWRAAPAPAGAGRALGVARRPAATRRRRDGASRPRRSRARRDRRATEPSDGSTRSPPMSREAIEAYVDLYRSDLRGRVSTNTSPVRSSIRSVCSQSPGFQERVARAGMTFAGFELSDELQMLRDLVRRFVAEQLRPAEASLPADARRIPDDVLDCAARSRAHRGSLVHGRAGGVRGRRAVRVRGGRVLGGSLQAPLLLPRSPVGARSGTPRPVVLYAGTPEQIDTWVRPAIADGWTGFSAVAEPAGGTDPARAIATTATPTADGWVLNGTKLWITHADHAQYGVVYARTEHGISTFVLSTVVPGLTARAIPTMRDSWPCELVLDDVHLPPDALIGEEGQGLRLAGDLAHQGPALVRGARGRRRRRSDPYRRRLGARATDVRCAVVDASGDPHRVRRLAHGSERGALAHLGGSVARRRTTPRRAPRRRDRQGHRHRDAAFASSTA